MKKAGKILLYTIGAIAVLLLGLIIYYNIVVDIKEPKVALPPILNEPVKQGNGYTYIGSDWMRENKNGLYEVYVEGDAIERGIALGKLTQGLMHYQEEVFVDQLKEMVPSDKYLNFLKYLVRYYNRNLTDYIPQEYQEEIYGTSFACSHEYDYIGTPYERQLNYHAAHDLGHAMQDYMLVGCTSFAVWGEKSEDGELLVGRNFDFYMGDDFAWNKIVSFYNPTQGYKFAAVGWAGMIGVLSGMNEKGLTVTINAAKSAMPKSSAMPISLLARKILQYAQTIEEAYRIADSAKTFVSESILIASVQDGRAAIIEKSTTQTALYDPKGTSIVCANHFQSEAFKDDERNRENISTSDSPYREARAEELIREHVPLNYEKAVAILRDTRGLNNKSIGLGNEKALNQLLGHHSVVFQPEKRLMWVSTSPWQLGRFVAYDLNRIFSEDVDPASEISSPEYLVERDTFLTTPEYMKFLMFRQVRKIIRENNKKKVSLPDSVIRNFIQLNPDFYQAYDIAGDAFAVKGETDQAIACWKQALSREIPKKSETQAIEKKIKAIRKE